VIAKILPSRVVLRGTSCPDTGLSAGLPPPAAHLPAEHLRT
jgi:hypothetical protein